MQNWITLLAVLVTSASTLAGVFLGAWLTWRCLKPEPLLDKPVDEDLPDDASENEAEPDEPDNEEEDFDDLR